MTRTKEKGETLSRLGATPVVADVYDADSLTRKVVDFGPEVIVNQLTDLPDDPDRIAEYGAANSRIRREGTDNLIAAGQAAGATRFVTQSVAWDLSGDAADAIDYLETAALDAGGVVFRYGRFYGPGTYFEGEIPSPPRIHIDRAARRTADVLATATGILSITEDQPPT